MRAFFVVSAVSAVSCVVGCVGDPVDVDGQCFQPAEQGLAVSNDVYMQFPRGSNNHLNENGIRLNGIHLNDIYMQMPRGSNNRLNENGTALSGTGLSGVGVDVRLDGSRLVVTRGKAVVADEDLVGVTLRAKDGNGAALDLVIDRVEVADAEFGLAFYDLSVGGARVCADGERGLFVEGSFDDRGAFTDDARAVTYACAGGVIHKCVLWGYAPWLVGSDLHSTCTRLARADYCGDGVSWTQEHTVVDVFDAFGVQSPANLPELAFEAGWNQDGAVCVDTPRYQINDGGAAVLPSCWADKPRCSSFDDAKAQGALIANASAHEARPLCR